MLSAAILCGLLFIMLGCNTGIEISPDPGILRVTLQSDPADTSIVIVPDTLNVAPNDSFGVTIFQGKAYNDSFFAVLYKSLKSTQQEDIIYNIIKIENGKYKKFTIFESYVPPADYNKIRFGIKPTVLKFSGFDEIKVESVGEANLFVELSQQFVVSENRITEVNVQISPFKSIQRYRDTYQFIPKVKTINVTYY